MKLTFHTEYSFRIIIFLLLRPGETIPTREIAERYGISVNHLNKVSQVLVNKGIVRSFRGKGGGIALEEKSKKMKLGTLMKSLEPAGEVAQCSGTLGSKACTISPVCGLRGMLADAQNAFWQHLDQYVIEDLVKENRGEMLELLS